MSRSTSYPAWCRSSEQETFLEFPRLPDGLVEAMIEQQRQLNALTLARMDCLNLATFYKRCDHSFTLYTVSRGWFCKYCKQGKGV